jgi:PAS domain S-box-containing protein
MAEREAPGESRGGLRVLHLDGDEAVLAASERHLPAAEDIASVTTTTDPDVAAALLRGESTPDGGPEPPATAAPDAAPFDCVVSEYDLPGADGAAFLEQVREQHPDLPLVVFTQAGSERVASEAVAAGATGYLPKGSPDAERFAVLADRVRSTVADHRTEQAADRSAERVRQVYERITDAFVALDRELRFTYLNERAEALLQADADALRGRHVAEAFPFIEGSAALDAYRRALDEQEPTTVEEYAEPLDRWLEIRSFPAPDGISVYFRDITERKDKEAELREERAFTESIFTGLPDALYAFDPDGTFLRWNDRFAEVTGYDDEEIAEMRPLEFVPDDEVETIAANIAAVVEDGERVTVESYFETKAGERIPYEFTGAPLVDQDGTELGLVGIGRDITDRREREREFEAVFNNTYQLTGLMAPDGTLLRANDTALEFAGAEREDVVGRHLAETAWITDENRERVYDAAERAAAGEFVRFEMEIFGAEGAAVIDFSLKPVTDDDGEVVLLIPEGRDITDRRERERELERKNERLEAFTSVVSHDLKNPLSVAAGSLELYRETGAEEEELVDQAADALDRMDRLIEDLLDLAEKGRVVDDPGPVSLATAVERAVATVETGGVEVTVAEVDHAVLADADRLVQLLGNLLSNAVEHAAGRVRIDVADGGRRLAVADDGPGIPPGDRELVFRPGHSDAEDGHGFGLAIARNIAEAHGWSLGVTESEWGGARFEVTGIQPAEPAAATQSA